MNSFDFENWPRRQHFEFFKGMTQPYFNVCVKINAKNLYEQCKQQGNSFFYAYLHCTLTACYNYEPMMLRIIDGKPIKLNDVRASVVELTQDDTFRFSYFSMYSNYVEFEQHATRVSQQVKENPLFSEAFEETEGKADLIHVSVLPWLNFSGFSHAFDMGNTLGIPKFVFGQYDKITGLMPLAIDVHHSLLDGLHVAKFVNMLQKQLG
jgi:chloramphenicol O-acetyltransferase type A